MYKITEIEVLGYKNILKADLTLDNFNVLIGPNNSGKSNFIQIFSFLNYIINSSMDDISELFEYGFYPTDFDNIVPEKKSKSKRKHRLKFRLKFVNYDSNRTFNYNLEIECNEKNNLDIKSRIIFESFDVKGTSKPGIANNIFTREKDSVKYGSDLSKTKLFENVPGFFSVIRFLKIVPLQNEMYKDAIKGLDMLLKSPVFYFSNTELLREEKSERLKEFMGRTISTNLKEDIIKLEETKNWGIFKSAINNILRIENVKVINLLGVTEEDDDDEGSTDEFKYVSFTHFGKAKELYEFSDGSILIIAIITKILSSNDDLIIIEEPENSTHPKALIDLLAFLKSFSNNKQYIIATHSIAILNKTRIDDIIVSAINEDGYSNFYNIKSRADLRKKLMRGHINFSDELFFSIDPFKESEIEY